MNMYASQLQVDGLLAIQLDHASARLEAKEGKVNIHFPSFLDMWHFHRIFRKMQKQKIALPLEGQKLLETLHVFYLINEQLIAEMSPSTIPNWGAYYTGLKNLHLSTFTLCKSFFSNLYKN